MSNKGKYISVGVLRYRSELDDKKNPTREYRPGQVIDEDLDQADVARWLKKGVIREAKLAKREQQARDEAAQAAAQSQEAQERAEAAAEAAKAGTTPDEPAVTRAGKRK